MVAQSSVKTAPSLVRQMWMSTVSHLVMGLCLTAACLIPYFTFLQSTQNEEERLSHDHLAIQHRLDAEQDPAKLRREITGLWSTVINQESSQEMLLWFSIKMFALLGLVIFASGLTTGVFAYRLHRQDRKNRTELSSKTVP